MKLFVQQAVVWPIVLLAMASLAGAQNHSHVAYVYPGGGCIGTETEIIVGGQRLVGASGAYFSGDGITATVVSHWRQYTQGEAMRVRFTLDVARMELETTDEEGRTVGKRAKREDIEKLALKMELVTPDKLKGMHEYNKNRANTKLQENPQLADTVTLLVKIDAGATLGRRDLRLMADAGLSNAIRFEVGELPEHSEVEPNNITLADDTPFIPPVTLNGQILPGDVDRFRFKANKGEMLVLATSARKLVPYLADAVPGWFQATVTLYNSDGIEVGYCDDYTFHPDPVLFYEVPRSGFYGLEIRDSIYRGRRDFVYRIALGQLPFITSIFPLGCRLGEKVTVELQGYNLPEQTLEFDSSELHVGRFPISLRGELLSNSVPFVVDTLPEHFDAEPNNDVENSQTIRPPTIINGRIDEPGDRDVFRFEGRKGGKVLIEVLARRINSPMDSLLKLTGPDGKTLMVNDDTVDRGEGLCTHHADSLLEVELPADGTYHIHLADTQKKGGVAYGYRLRISARRPDFDLRVAPSAINARPGQTKTITVYALRRDGFDGEISITLNNPPPGLTLSGGPIPADKDQLELQLTVPSAPTEKPLKIGVDGIAEINGKEVVRSAVPADDTMQAFLYRHLLTTKELLVSVNKPKPKKKRGR